jgi:hypothetical protein
MLRGTPNERHLDRFVRDVRERYTRARIEGWSDAELRAARHAVAAEVARFAGSFPEPGSRTRGDGAGGAAGEGKRPLSTFERRRLARVESEARCAIDRLVDEGGGGDDDEDAEGTRGRLRRAIAALRALRGPLGRRLP